MRAGAILLALLALAGCAAPDPVSREDRTAPAVLPKGYSDEGVPATPVLECGTPQGRSRYDPKRTLNPAGLTRDAQGRPTGPELDRIRREGLVVGVSQTAPLLSRRDLVTGELEGHEIDIVRRIAAELELPDDKLRMVTMPTGNRLIALKTDKNRQQRAANPQLSDAPEVDMAVADVTLTCDRVVNFGIMYSTPYLKTNAGILSRAGAQERTRLADFPDQKVCAAGGTTSIRELDAAKDSTRIRPVSVSDSSDCLVLLQRGLVEAVYTDTPILQGLQLQDPGTVLTDLPGVGGGLAGVAMSAKHKDLIRFVNGVLVEMRADGSLDRTWRRWFVDEVTKAGLPPVAQLSLPPVTYVD